MQYLKSMLESGVIEYLDYAFAGLLARRFGESSPEVLTAAALTSQVTCQGHVCLDLDDPGYQLPDADFEHSVPGFMCECQRLKRCLEKSVAVGYEDEYKPLIISGNRLYLNRYFNYEIKVAQHVERLCSEHPDEPDPDRLAHLLGRYFGNHDKQGVNWSKVAAVTAALKKLCIVSGGPGTGKTYTAARIVAVLLEGLPGKMQRILLAAPTGKAAARLEESFKEAGDEFKLPASVKDAFPSRASTIHRMLGIRANGERPRFNASNPLPADLVLVDESSMIDLALMHCLLEALAPDARLILLGDKDQLASVEAGSVLGDLCGKATRVSFSSEFAHKIEKICSFKLPRQFLETGPGGCLNDHLVFLTKSHRFDPSGGIGALAKGINAGRSDDVIRMLSDSGQSSVRWIKPGSGLVLKNLVQNYVLENYDLLFSAENRLRRLQALERFKILCAVRPGPFGVESLNKTAEAAALKTGLIESRYLDTWPWYPGRPVLILRNDYRQQLFNGDTGVTVAQQNQNGGTDFSVAFSTAEGNVRQIPVSRLPDLVTVFAATVHRSQGSEYDKVLIVLPDRDNPILSRELLYTAVTRAREQVVIWADEKIVLNAVQKRLRRASGLERRLWH